jgi:polynucleotide 5'-kinase involved in rRNA processing
LDEISARRNELTTLKGDLDAKMLEEKQAAIEVKATTAVKEHDRLNLVICGPGDSGETTLANYLAQEHQRKVIKFAGLYDW